MKVDLEHLHFWMSAIRQSNDYKRVLDAFWKGQIKSKEWLIDKLHDTIVAPVSVDIHGGWVGVLASMLFQSDVRVTSIRSIDIDPTVEDTAKLMNQIELEAGRFTALTADMCDVESNADIVINTSCEHISQEQYAKWLDKVSSNSILVLQSNNYKIEEHIRTADSLEEFETQSGIKKIWSGTLSLPLYDRYMIIGSKI